jgi:poly(3-hydroxybutyrate) depolymerase
MSFINKQEELMKKFAFYIFITLLSYLVTAQDYSFQTYEYLKDDSTALELDLFLPDSCISGSPVVIFLHGGGFSNGTRKNGHPFCQFLAKSGIASATISYSLYMKNKNFSCEGLLSEKIKAIQLAAYQAQIATLWIIKNSLEFNIDTTKIFLSGSSAGAEAVLQAAYWDTSSTNFFTDTLAPDFKYAGVISGAGAVLDINLINPHTKIPTLCFHGTCDLLVPYYIAPHHYCSQISRGYMMMFGGFAIYEKLTSLNESTQLISYCGEGHKHAGSPFNEEGRYEVLEFVESVSNGESFNIHRVYNNGIECKLSLDYIHCFSGL